MKRYIRNGFYGDYHIYSMAQFNNIAERENTILLVDFTSDDTIFATEIVEKGKYYCPTCVIECPYCIGLDYECVIDNPMENCDEYWWYHQDEEG